MAKQEENGPKKVAENVQKEEPRTDVVLDGFLPFKGCRGFCENTSDQPQTVTITIYNPGPGSMDIRFQNKKGDLLGGDEPVTIVEEGEYKTIIVTIPAKQRVHGEHDGYRKPV
jgi:hypothetical protein